MREFHIAGKTITDDSPAYVIAELGHNHGGSVDVAEKMIRRAAECGVDAIKLQKRHNKTLFTSALYNAPYENENSYGKTYGAHREALELDFDAFRYLRQVTHEVGLDFIATAFDAPSVDFLYQCGLAAFKVASGDCKNTPLMRQMRDTGLPLIVSTGGATVEDVDRISDLMRSEGLAILQCTAAYPAEPRIMDLRVVSTYMRRYQNVIGLSDHQNGIALAPVAYALGARIIEKHFTLNRASKGTDHAFSLEPQGLRKLVRDLGRVKDALGDGVKKVHPEEEKPLYKMGKGLYAARDIPVGHVLEFEDLAIKSPTGPIEPYWLAQVVGMRTKRPLAADEAVDWEAVK